jgi:hypothetical protein
LLQRQEPDLGLAVGGEAALGDAAAAEQRALRWAAAEALGAQARHDAVDLGLDLLADVVELAWCACTSGYSG